MKNLMVANLKETDKRYQKENIERFLKAQIDNSLELGWLEEDIIVITNFDFSFMNVKALNLGLNDFCMTGSKMFAIQWCYKFGSEKGPIWAHDLDAWQNSPFFYPETDIKGNKLNGKWDAAATYYSKPKFNGGSVFWKKSALDIIDSVVTKIQENNASREEPTINFFFTDKKFSERIAILDNTYNVGCSGFVPRYNRSTKPIRVCHLHPNNRIAWETHVLDRNGQDFRSVSPRLEKLLRKYWPNLAVELQPDGVTKASKLRSDRISLLKTDT